MNKKLLLISNLLVLPLLFGCNKQAENPSLITTRSGLAIAVSQSQKNDVIYVGDVGFETLPTLPKSFNRISINKSITIKGGYKDRKAKLSGGSFDLVGTKVAGENLKVHFENIEFDGIINGSSLADSNWNLSEENALAPEMCNYASFFKGNVKASYSNCEFKNYANPNGGALWGLYADYSNNISIIQNYGDNSQCKLDISLDNCSFEDNYSRYGGGAIFLDANKRNITLTANKTSFKGNKTGCLEYCLGGGACCLDEVISLFNDCSFSNNNGSYSYGYTVRDVADISGIPEEFIEEYLATISDQTSGGAIRTSYGKCVITNSSFISNRASLGGAISTYCSELTVDGCAIKENNATCDLLKKPSDPKGPWSNMGLGGGIYINSSNGYKNDIVNTSFYKNIARNGYGSICSFYDGIEEGNITVPPEVNVNFCSFLDNTEVIKYTEDMNPLWCARPGNLFDIPYIKFKGCLVNDDLSGKFFNKYEKPSKENNYCYFSDNSHCEIDKVSLVEKDDRIIASSTGELSLTIPSDFARKVFNGRYGNNEPKSFILGSNYNPNLYKVITPRNVNTPLIIFLVTLGVVLLSAGIIAFILFNKRKQSLTVNSSNDGTKPLNVDEMMIEIEKEHKLTDREKDVLKLLLLGKKRMEIAEALFLSESAIKKYTSSIYEKLEVHSKLELIMKFQKKK